MTRDENLSIEKLISPLLTLNDPKSITQQRTPINCYSKKFVHIRIFFDILFYQRSFGMYLVELIQINIWWSCFSIHILV